MLLKVLRLKLLESTRLSIYCCNTTVMLFFSKGSEVTGVLEVVAEETLVLADRGDGMRVEVATDLSGDHLVGFRTAQKKHAIQISDILIQFPFYLFFGLLSNFPITHICDSIPPFSVQILNFNSQFTHFLDGVDFDFCITTDCYIFFHHNLFTGSVTICWHTYGTTCVYYFLFSAIYILLTKKRLLYF